MRAFLVVFGLLLILAGAWIALFVLASATMIDATLGVQAWWERSLTGALLGGLVCLPFVLLGVCSIATGGRADKGGPGLSLPSQSMPDLPLGAAIESEPDALSQVIL